MTFAGLPRRYTSDEWAEKTGLRPQPAVGREARIDTFSCGIPGSSGYTSMTVTDTLTGRSVSGTIQHVEGASFGLRERLLRELYEGYPPVRVDEHKTTE